MSDSSDWVDPKELGGLSQSGNILEKMGYDPDEVRMRPELRAKLMEQLSSPYGAAGMAPAGGPMTAQPGMGANSSLRENAPQLAAMQPRPQAMQAAGSASAGSPMATQMGAQTTTQSTPVLPSVTPRTAAQPGPTQQTPPAPGAQRPMTQSSPAPQAAPMPQTTGATSAQVAPARAGGSGAAQYDNIADQALRKAMGLGESAEQMAKDLGSTTGPETADLEAQRAKDAMPTPYRDPDTGKVLDSAKKAGYKPGIGTEILRGLRGGVVGLMTGGIPGAVVGAIEPQDIRGGTAYGAPDRAYQATEATRTARLGSEDQQLQNVRDQFKAMIESKGKAAGEMRQGQEAFTNIAKESAALQNAETNVSKNQTQLRKAGYKTDGQGNIAPLDRSEMSPEQLTQMDLHSALQEQAEARAALARAQNDPNSPAFKLASQRAATANANAGAAIERAQAYALNATGANFGTDTAGNPLQGSTVVGNKPVGSKFQATVQNQQGRVAQFNDVLGATDNLENTARRLVNTRGKGAISSTKVAAALAEPIGTFGKWVQGQVANGMMSPEERDYVTNLRAFRENLQALRKSAGGGVSDSQVDRLMEMAPGAATPDLDYLLRQTGQIRATANRLSKGIPNVTGGNQVQGSERGAQPAATSGGDNWFTQHPKAK